MGKNYCHFIVFFLFCSSLSLYLSCCLLLYFIFFFSGVTCFPFLFSSVHCLQVFSLWLPGAYIKYILIIGVYFKFITTAVTCRKSLPENSDCWTYDPALYFPPWERQFLPEHMALCQGERLQQEVSYVFLLASV